MGLFDKAKGEFIDIIEWTDDTNDTLVYRFERYQSEIKNGAQLTVREGQQAIFVNEGQIADIYQPGRHVLKTENMPILTTLKGWKYGFDSPFKVDVYFVNTKNFLDQKWGTKNPIILNDNRFGMLEVRAFGTYILRIADGGKFLRGIVGTSGHFTTEDIADQLRSIIVARFTDTVGEASFPIEAFAANLNEFSASLFTMMKPDFDQLGLDLTKFIVENISMPDDVKKEIFELSRLNKVDLQKLAQLKAAKALEVAAANESSMAGAGMGMGMGFAMAQQMGNMMNQPGQPAQTGPSAGPPPLPNAMAIFVGLDGQQAGPFDSVGLKDLISQQKLTRETLVWKEGMGDWQPASQVAEVNALFGATPPPLPKK